MWVLQERERRQKEWDAVMSERDILGTQLVRRNDELGLLYEKVKLQASTLTRGQLQYRDRLAEIRALRLKLTDLRRELHILRNSVANVDVLKHEVHHLGRELLQVRGLNGHKGDMLTIMVMLMAMMESHLTPQTMQACACPAETILPVWTSSSNKLTTLGNSFPGQRLFQSFMNWKGSYGMSCRRFFGVGWVMLGRSDTPAV